ncbi:MAG: diaminopimelate epimerase [Proteobacteria bacterium]|jgi:diaminopimelate epimerase|nr:diaminopimelate epimerase [Pseudomonadota bacterium]NCX65303.1 diaminopimelate epimerase [Pseudomonadota bacterium]
MDIKAFKMDGLGNDFVIIDNRSNQIHLSNEQIVKICNREFIGCDQLIIIKDNSETDASVEFFNSDGSPSGACGNGTRCVADLLSKEKKKNSITVTTESGNLNSKILGNNMVTTQIGVARTEWHEIPLSKNLDTKNLNIKILDSDNKEFFGGMAINVGNPHLIFFIKNLEKFNIEKIGPQLEVHEFFPEKCNVTIAEVVNKDLIKVKVWERGAGLTKACGTAACATAMAGKLNNLTEDKVDIQFKSGILNISIDDQNMIHMKGPVSNIQDIEIKL